MLTTVEGTYRNGQVTLEETPGEIVEGKVLVTFLASSHRNGNGKNNANTTNSLKPGQMYFGMFPELLKLTDEDFKAAEFHGDPDDGLDWP